MQCSNPGSKPGCRGVVRVRQDAQMEAGCMEILGCAMRRRLLRFSAQHTLPNAKCTGEGSLHATVRRENLLVPPQIPREMSNASAT